MSEWCMSACDSANTLFKMVPHQNVQSYTSVILLTLGLTSSCKNLIDQKETQL